MIYYLSSGQGSSSPPTCYFGGQTPAAQPGGHLGPASWQHYLSYL